MSRLLDRIVFAKRHALSQSDPVRSSKNLSRSNLSSKERAGWWLAAAAGRLVLDYLNVAYAEASATSREVRKVDATLRLQRPVGQRTVRCNL
jgi:hypothetical protein